MGERLGGGSLVGGGAGRMSIILVVDDEDVGSDIVACKGDHVLIAAQVFEFVHGVLVGK